MSASEKLRSFSSELSERGMTSRCLDELKRLVEIQERSSGSASDVYYSMIAPARVTLASLRHTLLLIADLTEAVEQDDHGQSRVALAVLNDHFARESS